LNWPIGMPARAQASKWLPVVMVPLPISFC
jgi:hypothetical protein